MLSTDMKYNIELEAIQDPKYVEMDSEFSRAMVQMRQRTYRYEVYGLLAKNKNIHEFYNKKKYAGNSFSEGSTQYILRKSLANTIQRVPDGELETQFDKASRQHIATEYLFNNKVLYSEIEGLDMLSNLTNTFKMGFTYGFAPIRTGFEKDFDNDARISYNIENWSDVFPDADCKDIRHPQVVYHRSYMSKAEVKALLDENGNIIDSTYNEDTVKYVLDHELFSAKYWESEKQQDKLKGSTALSSLRLLTKYERGADEFVTYVPEIKAVFRTVPNYDPRKGIPWNFFVLEPDPDFPFGLSQIEFLLADQQFQDLFQTSAYKNLLLAMEPPIMVSGWETNPASYVFEPRKIWNLGNNPNQVKVEPVRIDNAVLSNFLTTREGVASGMLRQLNVMDGTVASDAGVPGYSGTPQGVEAQQRTKEVSINQYQKRVEYFFAEWSNQALRMYINAMKGKHWLTVDETTRRRMFDIDMLDYIKGDKILIDFDELSTDLLNFKVRTGSLVERKEDQERKALQDMVQPFVQNLNGWSEENKAIIENEVLLPAAKRLLELSDADINQTIAESLGTQIAKLAMKNMEQDIASQQQQLSQQGEKIDALSQALPPEVQEQLAQGQTPVPDEEGIPASASSTVEGDGGGSSPSLPPTPEDGIMLKNPVNAGQQVTSASDLLEM